MHFIQQYQHNMLNSLGHVVKFW